MDHVIDFTAVKARAKDLVLLSHFLAGIPTSLMGDPARLSQVLTALIGNAIKFTDSGEVLLTIHNNESGNSGEIDFDVSDTGVGIPPISLKRYSKISRKGTHPPRANTVVLVSGWPSAGAWWRPWAVFSPQRMGQ